MTFTVQPRYLVLVGVLVLGLAFVVNAMRMSNASFGTKPSCGDRVQNASQAYFDEHGTYPDAAFMDSIRQAVGCAR